MIISVDGKETTIKSEALEKIKEELHKQALSWTAGVTCGATAQLDGTYSRQGTACHSWVSTSFSRGYASDTFFVCTASTTKRSKGVCKPESLEAFKSWLVSDKSPFAKYVVNRDDEESLKDGFIIICDKGGASFAETLWVCKALRYGVEGAGALDVWKTLYDGGVNPILALAAATYIRTVRGASFGYTGLDYHSCVFGYRADIPVEGIIRGKVDKKATETYRLFSGSKSEKSISTSIFDDKMSSFCSTRKSSDGWGGFITEKGTQGEEFVKNILAFQKEYEAYVPEKERWNYGEPVGQGDEVCSPVVTAPTASTVFLDFDV